MGICTLDTLLPTDVVQLLPDAPLHSALSGYGCLMTVSVRPAYKRLCHQVLIFSSMKGSLSLASLRKSRAEGRQRKVVRWILLGPKHLVCHRVKALPVIVYSII